MSRELRVFWLPTAVVGVAIGVALRGPIFGPGTEPLSPEQILLVAACGSLLIGVARRLAAGLAPKDAKVEDR